MGRAKKFAMMNPGIYAVGQGVQVLVDGEWLDAEVAGLPLLSGNGEWQVRYNGKFGLFDCDSIRHMSRPVQPEPDAGAKAAAQFSAGFPGFE